MTGPSRREALVGLAALPLVAAAPLPAAVRRLDPALDAVIDPAARPERIATGLRWAEGPAWSRRGGYLLFSDVPANVVHRWQPGGEATPFLSPSGLQGAVPPGVREAGANGLAFLPDGTLLLADSGSRAIVRFDPATKRRTVLADRHDGKRFNSPNDLAVARSGAIYFTDPPYGLEGGNDSSLKEQPHNGLYRLDPDGGVTLLDAGVSWPNGVTLSPDERTLYVGVSDEARPVLLAYQLGARGAVVRGRVLQDMAADRTAGGPGLPDGVKTDTAGRIYATGPGGVHVLTPDGRRLGTIATGQAIANVAFGEDGRTLFLASNDSVYRIRLRARGWA